MNKTQFLQSLAEKINRLPQKDADKSLEFYAELIDDYVEEGMTEEEAVQKIGTPEEAARQIMLDAPLGTLLKARLLPQNGLPVWAVALLILTSPVWFILGVVLAVAALCLFLATWVVAIVGFAATLALAAGGIGLVVVFPLATANGPWLAGLLTLGVGLSAIGLAVYFFFASIYLAKYAYLLNLLILRAMKKSLIKKEKKQ